MNVIGSNEVYAGRSHVSRHHPSGFDPSYADQSREGWDRTDPFDGKRDLARLTQARRGHGDLAVGEDRRCAEIGADRALLE